MEKMDARKRYTQMVLKQSFLKLLKEKPVNRITVKEVCALAQLNRATFYAHYSDCFALMESIENELIDAFEKSLRYVNLFDVTMELQGLSSYQKVWSAYEDYFRTGLRVFRDQLNIHAEPDMAFVHGFCKIDVESGKPTPGVVWCRTTICLRKKSGKWKIIHQHVSLPHPVESIVSMEWNI